MSNLVCPQCLCRTCIDCQEAGCPGYGGFRPLEQLRPDRKMMETMGERIETLERLVLSIADYLDTPLGKTSNPSPFVTSVMAEAGRIRGKKKKEGADDGC